MKVFSRANKVQVPLLTKRGVEKYIYVDAEFQVCPNCKGRGTIDPPSFVQGWTSSEWAQEDPDFHESYLKGDYDVPCPMCGSIRVVLRPKKDILLPKIVRAAANRYSENLYMTDQEY